MSLPGESAFDDCVEWEGMSLRTREFMAVCYVRITCIACVPAYDVAYI